MVAFYFLPFCHLLHTYVSDKCDFHFVYVYRRSSLRLKTSGNLDYSVSVYDLIDVAADGLRRCLHLMICLNFKWKYVNFYTTVGGANEQPSFELMHLASAAVINKRSYFFWNWHSTSPNIYLIIRSLRKRKIPYHTINNSFIFWLLKEPINQSLLFIPVTEIMSFIGW